MNTLEYIDYLVKTAESVGIEGVNQDVPISVETCVEIMRRLDAKIPRWIPVSERLPNFNDIVLASSDSDYDELRVILTVYSGEEFWLNGKIKAWMPLPEPYKEE